MDCIIRTAVNIAIDLQRTGIDWYVDTSVDVFRMLCRFPTLNALVFGFPEGEGTPGCMWGNWGLCGNCAANMNF